MATSIEQEKKLSILITNVVMSDRTGTEMATYELALSLYKRGHRVVIYSPQVGWLGKELSIRGVPVMDDIARINFIPDIIHGHHNIPLAVAMLKFRETPALFVCHDASYPFDIPILADRIYQHVAVDCATRDRLIAYGISPENIELLINAVDTDQYNLRSEISKSPKNALIVVKGFYRPDRIEGYIQKIQSACEVYDIACNAIGIGIAKEIDNYWEVLKNHDIVFAVGRSAIEACCTGAHVILTHELGFGGVLDSDTAKNFIHSKFCRRITSGDFNKENILSAIERYDTSEIYQAAIAWRKLVSIDLQTDRWIALYRNVIQKHHNNLVPVDDGRIISLVASTLPQAVSDIKAIISVKSYDNHFLKLSLLDEIFDNLAIPGAEVPISSKNPHTAAVFLDDGWSYLESWGGMDDIRHCLNTHPEQSNEALRL